MLINKNLTFYMSIYKILTVIFTNKLTVIKFYLLIRVNLLEGFNGTIKEVKPYRIKEI